MGLNDFEALFAAPFDWSQHLLEGTGESDEREPPHQMRQFFADFFVDDQPTSEAIYLKEASR